MIPRPEDLKSGICTLPNGCELRWELNAAGGRTYYSNEIGGFDTLVWDTAFVDQSTLLAALAKEAALEIFEAWQRQKMPTSEDANFTYSNLFKDPE